MRSSCSKIGPAWNTGQQYRKNMDEGHDHKLAKARSVRRKQGVKRAMVSFLSCFLGQLRR